jgi:ribonuclease P protein component
VISSVGRRRTFSDLRRDGRRVRHGPVRLNHLALPDLPDALNPEVAFAFGRRFGTAVERNRSRRRLKEAFVAAWRAGSTERADRLRGAFLMSGSRGLLHAPFRELVRHVEACLDELVSPVEATPL